MLYKRSITLITLSAALLACSEGEVQRPSGGDNAESATGGAQLGTGGTILGMGGQNSSSGGQSTGPDPLGFYFQAGDFSGYGYTNVGEVEGGTISPLDSDFTSGAGEVCVQGTLIEQYASLGVLGMTVNQAQGSENADAWIPGVEYSGVYVNLSKTVDTVIRAVLIATDGKSYCADHVAAGGTNLRWNNFKTECWGNSGTAYDPSLGFTKIQFYAPGDVNSAVEFGYCLNELYPTKTSDEPPATVGNYPFGNAPVPSAGCGKSLGALKTGKHSLTSAGLARSYNLDLPENYDPQKPYRLVFGMHFLGGSADVVRNDGWYGLKPHDPEQTTIWVAPQGYTDSSPWRGGDDKDHTFFEDMVQLFSSELCVDTSRIFSVGWSFGAMFTNSLAQRHQDTLRGVVVFSAADFNIYFPENTGKPLAYMGVHGIYDTLCPFESGQRSKDRFVKNNGCTGPNPAPENTGGPTHVTVDYEGCGNHPVRWATFSGGHIWDAKDNGAPTWVPGEVWEFISQF